MEAPSKEPFLRHKLSVSGAWVPRRERGPCGVIRTGERVFTVSQAGIQTFLFTFFIIIVELTVE